MSKKGGNPNIDHLNLVAALQEQLSGMIGGSSGFLESLPEPVKRRLNALKNLQKKRVTLEAQIQKEIQELEKKLNTQSLEIFKKRKDIVNGLYEPTEEECKCCDDEDHEHEDQPKPEAGKESSTDDKGIPGFWLGAIQNCHQLAPLIEEHDVPILDFLTDIEVVYLDTDMGYRLDFYFAENPHFTNKVLSKTYYLSIEPDEHDLIFEGPVYDHAEGTEIEWKEGKDVTVKQEKKKQRKKGGDNKGKVRTVVKTVKQESFFHFFTAPEPINEEEDDEEKIATQEELLSQDFEIGEAFREKIIPMAVLYFTGDSELFEDDGDDYDEDDDEDDDDEYQHGHIRELKDGDDDDDDDDVAAPAGGDGKPTGEKPPECKQS